MYANGGIVVRFSGMHVWRRQRWMYMYAEVGMYAWMLRYKGGCVDVYLQG